MTGLLLTWTAALVLVGCGLYVRDSVGLAQLAWVMASGTAGGAIASWVDDRKPR